MDIDYDIRPISDSASGEVAMSNFLMTDDGMFAIYSRESSHSMDLLVSCEESAQWHKNGVA